MDEKKLRSTKLIGDAGEFYVAFNLARRGVHPALLSTNAKGADLLVTDDGQKIVSIQVKTSAARHDPRIWQVNKPPSVSKDFFFVFLNVFDDESKPVECFIVPSQDVLTLTTWNKKWHNFKITKAIEPDYKDRWDLILKEMKALKR